MSTATAPVVAPVSARPLTMRNYLAYAAGDAANNLSFTMAGMFLILYYTNVVGVEGAVIGTMFLVVRFVDHPALLVVPRLRAGCAEVWTCLRLVHLLVSPRRGPPLGVRHT